MPFALIAVLLVGIAVTPSAAEEAASVETSAYRVGAGDVLPVEAYPHEEISGSFAVETNGDISFPLSERAGRKTLSAEDLLDFGIDTGLFEPVALFGVAGCEDAVL